ncbi:hypothetical protein MVEN_02148100 [Mycena venus]|uniref:Protein kinase domain-containing protein n=1 Tax=Mycena venus TaxID=2733690 RepID=A0A8H7CH18_9AGAR|nr:hypothetical protein MVEN_02148100 [Mycena venus]
MNDEMHPAPEQSSSQSNPGIVGGPSHAAVFNTGARDINMIGCTTTSNFAFMTAPAEPSDFRMIPLGDIDLQHEIRVDYYTGFVEWRREQTRVRRLYSARIEGRKAPATVAIYQGNSAKEEWERDIAKYISARHPNIIQIYAAASSNNIHATVFYDDLVPFQEFVDFFHHHSPILEVYYYTCGYIEFEAVRDYFQSAFQHFLGSVKCTFLIRRSTGRLCVDLIHGNILLFLYRHQSIRSVETVRQQGCQSLNTPDQQAMVGESLTLEQYHSICRWDLSQNQTFTIPTASTVNLGAVISYSSGNLYEDSVEIASLSDVFIPQGCWESSEEPIGEVMEDGWTRCASTDVLNNSIELRMWSPHAEAWLSQANHIFSCLQISSNFQDYVVLDTITFKLAISAVETDPAEGFLFLCPMEDFRTGPSSFNWPDRPAYWSLDPSGAGCLSTDDADRLGFPSTNLSAEIAGQSWDARVCAGLSRFHQAKGFDPESQDVARHLGQPLYQFSTGINAPFAHLDDAEDDEAAVFVADVTQTASGENRSVLEDTCLPEETPVSLAFGFIMNVQLALILFLTLFQQ